jgi:hypothetical protein
LYVVQDKSQSQLIRDVVLGVGVFESRSLKPDLYEKLEQRLSPGALPRPGKLFVRHSVSKSEMAGLLCRVIVVSVEDRVLYQLSLSTHL